MEDDTKALDAPSDGTQPGEGTQAPQDGPGDAEQNAGTSSQGTTATENEDQGGNDIKSEEGKISQLEKDRNQAQQETKQAQQDLANERKKSSQPKELDEITAQALNKQFHGNRAGYEQWRQKWVAEGGIDYGAYDQVYQGYDPSRHVQNTQTAGTGGTPSMTQQDVYKAVDFITDIKGLLKKFPELDSSQASSPEDKKSREGRLKFVVDTADSKQALAQQEGKQLNRDQAIEESLIALDPTKYTEQAIADAQLTGMQDALAKGAGTTMGSSTASTKASDVQLSDDDKAVAKQLRISEEDMLKQKKGL